MTVVESYAVAVVMCVITAIASAFLDNVTTVVLVGPITLFLAARLGTNPMPFIIAEILASNIGGAATLIGDPPNILIGSAANIDFATFAVHMGPLSAPPKRAARSDDAASSTAVMSSSSSSNDPSERIRSERPVPRRSNTISREKEASRSMRWAYDGHHWFCSRCERYPGAQTRSIGPSPITW